MSEIIERVAKALLDSRARVFNPHEMARAAIEAMREPTEDMRKAAHGVPVSAHWTVMIDEALK